MYTLSDLKNTIIVYEFGAHHDVLSKAIMDEFFEQLPHACLDDIPYVEYSPERGEVEVEHTIYTVGPKLQEYLKKAALLFKKLPLPEITLQCVEITVNHPETDDEDEKGSMEITVFRPPVGEPTCIESITTNS